MAELTMAEVFVGILMKQNIAKSKPIRFAFDVPAMNAFCYILCTIIRCCHVYCTVKIIVAISFNNIGWPLQDFVFYQL